MVSLRLAEEVTEVGPESDLQDRVCEHWFYSMPCPGVRFYSFDERPTRREIAEPKAMVDTAAGRAYLPSTSDDPNIVLHCALSMASSSGTL